MRIVTTSSKRKDGQENDEEEDQDHTHREYASHRLSLGSPLSPSNKLFLHSIRGLRSEEGQEEQGEDQGEESGVALRQLGDEQLQDRHRRNNNITERVVSGRSSSSSEEEDTIVNSRYNTFHNRREASWDSAIVEIEERKQHFTSRRGTLEESNEKIGVYIA